MKKFFVFILIVLGFTNLKAELSDTIWTHPLAGLVKKVKFSPDGKYIYAGSEANIITKIDVVTNKVIYEYVTPNKLLSMDLSKDGKYILLTGSKDTVLLINAEDKTLIRQFVIPAKPQQLETFTFQSPIAATISYDSKYCGIILNGSNNQKPLSSILIWELETGQLVANIEGNSNISSLLKFSPTENILAVGNIRASNLGKNVPIQLYETDTWKSIGTLAGHSTSIEGLNFSSDGNYLASWSGTDSNLIKIWDIKNRKLKQNINGIDYKISGAGDVCFFNNNSIITSSETVINLDKVTKTVIAQNKNGSGYLDINSANSKNLLAVADDGVTLYNLDKSLDVSPESNNPTPILYPNPVTKELNVSLQNINNIPVSYRIINSIGQEVLHNSSFVQNNIIKINVSSLVKGSYVLNIQLNNIIQSFNFIVRD